MANPFLMNDLECGDTQVTSTNGGFNPFLSGNDFTTASTDNPFMSTFVESSFQAGGASTNPFAFVSESQPTTDFFGSLTSEKENEPIHDNQFDNIFSQANQVSNSNVNDFFGGFTETSSTSTIDNTVIQASATSFLDDTSANFFNTEPLTPMVSTEGSGTSTPKTMPPRRPPPPRPPPSKETKDLILSVTGTMEATSSHLLDRLQATRTPSPTPIRDLNSPSPTPDILSDLLEVDETPKHSEIQEVNLLGDSEDETVTIAPIAPVQIIPSIIGKVIPTATVAPTPVPPSRPQPPALPQRPKLPPQLQSHFNVFSEPTPEPESVQNQVIDFFDTPPPLIQPSEPKPTLDLTSNFSSTPFDDRMVLDTQVQPADTTSSLFDSDVLSSGVDIQQANLVFTSSESSSMYNTQPINSGFETETVTSAFETETTTSTFETQPTSAFDTQPTSGEVTSTSLFDAQETTTSLFDTQETNTSLFDTQVTSTFVPSTDGIQPSTPFPVTAFNAQPIDSDFTNAFDTQTNLVFDAQPISNAFDSQIISKDIADVPENIFDNATVSAPESDSDFLFTQIESNQLDQSSITDNIFVPTNATILNTTPVVPVQPFNIFDQNPSELKATDDFDAFTAKFENAGFDEPQITKGIGISSDPFDPFSSSAFGAPAGKVEGDSSVGFGADDNFDSFLALQEPPPPPQSTPARINRGDSADSDDNNDFSIFIKPKQQEELGTVIEAGLPIALAPPPKSPLVTNAFQDSSPRFNPFDKSQEIPSQVTDNVFVQAVVAGEVDRTLERTDSQETPPTPLFDEDVSQPLEDFPRIHYSGLGWEMQLRQPNKKKITGQRFWKKVFVKLVYQGENPVLQLYNNKDDKDPFQELPLQPCYSVSDIGAQQYDNYGKIFTVKLQFIFYKERPGVRPGQVTKAERISNKLSQFAAFAIQGDYQGCKEFGSDLKKLGLPVEHAPQISQLFKIGSQNYEDMKQFSVCIEEALFRLPAHRDRALNYKMEEVQITAVDELYVDQNKDGGILKQIARVRLFFLGFLSGMPDVELGVNDLVRQGKEVVGRHDIIPVVTEEWIRLEHVEFHSCIQQDEYERTRTIRFKPPDACYIELMRFRVRPPRNRELPLQLKTVMIITGNKVELRADILVPGFFSRKLGQIPCEDVVVRFPIPECWIYLFRVEKHFRYGSVKSAHRRTGKIKGIERFLGAVDNMEPSLMETTSGQAKYEHQHRAIVWRMARLPKEGQGAYTTHNLVCRMALTSYDQIPEELAKHCYVEFTMPATQVSHTTVRSVSIANSDSDGPPEKYVRQLARHEYRVEIEFTHGEGPADYIAATVTAKPAPTPIPEEVPTPTPAAPDSDSDSSS